jgi:hypothetical protein
VWSLPARAVAAMAPSTLPRPVIRTFDGTMKPGAGLSHTESGPPSRVKHWSKPSKLKLPMRPSFSVGHMNSS